MTACPDPQNSAQLPVKVPVAVLHQRGAARDGKSPEFDLLSKSFANLMRMWVED